jgi:hypothetical protein
MLFGVDIVPAQVFGGWETLEGRFVNIRHDVEEEK